MSVSRENDRGSVLARDFVLSASSTPSMHVRFGLFAALVCTLPDAIGLIFADDPAMDRVRAIQAAVAQVTPSMVVVERYTADERPQTEGELNTGNGVLLDAEGHIATSAAVAGDPGTTLIVRWTPPGETETKRFAARLLARDLSRGVAVLHCAELAGTMPAPWQSSDQTQVGETVIAVSASVEGSPFAVSVGILSAKERVWGRFLQTDARVSPIFYGGPLINLRGEVLGLLVPVIPEDQSAGDPTSWYDAGIAFAATAWDLLARRERLISGQDVRAGLVGLTPESSDPYIGPPKIAGVRPYSPAARAGLRAGDVITAINSQLTPYNGDIRQRLGQYDAGSIVRFTIQRDGESLDRDVELAAELPPFVPQRLGVYCEVLDAQLRVVHVSANSPAAELGLAIGDRLIAAAGRQLDSRDALRQVITAHPPDERLPVSWQRNGETLEGQIALARIGTALPVEPITGDRWPEQWEVKPLPLPDVKNLAWALVPADGGDAIPPLGIMILLAEPGQAKPEELLAGLEEAARRGGVVFSVVTATLPDRWDGSELDVIERVASQLQNTLGINNERIAVAGRGASGAMALVVALAKRATFRAAAIEGEKLPSFRLRENDPGQPVQLLFAGPVAEAEPWSGLVRAGYAIRSQTSVGSPREWTDLLVLFNRALDEF